MFTSIDKALTALVMALLFIAQTYTGLSLGWIDQQTVTNIIALLSPVLVWAVPNKAKA